MSRIVYVITGWVSLATGVVAILVPLLPTTPFLLFAAFCFSRGSTYLHDWLVAHPLVGSAIRDWEDRGAIRLRAKVAASFLLFCSMSYPLIFLSLKIAWQVSIIVTFIGVLAFIWSRPN